MNKKYFLQYNILYDLYINQNLSYRQISEKINIDKNAIYYWLKKYEIQLRPIKLFTKGHKINLNKKKTNETKRKISKAHKGKKLSIETKQKISHTKIITKCHRGENNSNWQGGISSLRDLIRQSSNSINWRKQVFIRDNYTCQECGQHGGFLEVHHNNESFNQIFHDFLNLYNYLSPIHDKVKLLELALEHRPFWDINNGLTLCKDCHKNTKINVNYRKIKELI